MNFKYLICAFIGCMMSYSAFSASVYVVINCSNAVTTAQSQMCAGTTPNCGSSSTSVRPNTTYGYCGAFSVSGQSSKSILCFTTQAICQSFNECGDDYYTTTLPAVVLSSSGIGATTTTNDAQFTCCKTCGPGAWSDVSGQNYQQRYQRQCTTTGTCSNINQSTMMQRRCKAGYYNTKGLEYQSGTVPSCTSCATATGNTNSTSAAGAYAITQCYVPSGISQTNSIGTFEYTSSCYYSN